MDVNQIFKDLALMVHEQGELVDSIESNIEHAQISVEQGHSNVVKAHNYQVGLTDFYLPHSIIFACRTCFFTILFAFRKDSRDSESRKSLYETGNSGSNSCASRIDLKFAARSQ